MTPEQKIILDAAEMLLAANNKFLEYYNRVLPDLREKARTNPTPLPHPAEDILDSLHVALIEFKILGQHIGFNLEPVFKNFQLCAPV